MTDPNTKAALEAHEQHMARGLRHVLDYLEPKPDRISAQEFISRMIEHFDGPEQRACAALTEFALKENGNA